MKINISLDKGVLVSDLIHHAVQQVMEVVDHLRVCGLCCHIAGLRFNQKAKFQHFFNVLEVGGGEAADALGTGGDLIADDEGPFAMDAVQHPQTHKVTDGGPDAGAADAQSLRQLVFRRNFTAHGPGPILNIGLDEGDHLIGNIDFLNMIGRHNRFLSPNLSNKLSSL